MGAAVGTARVGGGAGEAREPLTVVVGIPAMPGQGGTGAGVAVSTGGGGLPVLACAVAKMIGGVVPPLASVAPTGMGHGVAVGGSDCMVGAGRPPVGATKPTGVGVTTRVRGSYVGQR